MADSPAAWEEYGDVEAAHASGVHHEGQALIAALAERLSQLSNTIHFESEQDADQSEALLVALQAERAQLVPLCESAVGETALGEAITWLDVCDHLISVVELRQQVGIPTDAVELDVDGSLFEKLIYAQAVSQR